MSCNTKGASGKTNLTQVTKEGKHYLTATSEAVELKRGRFTEEIMRIHTTEMQFTEHPKL